ncbi:phosphoribosylaminoimidazole-succinocarboxamide synthase, chloroplastic isoform X3 [Actinidia eriantha]|nr:phosphoribosylaminoimidazole-succinocarboxamide synthase, chloroplastic isoform X3 [Actinidia eriantha]XP_057504868.1 phosphoribosylaminoimidazole-succinocarboxamide synthase, chloroplastic isoform X3 [Actinidia eriantha]XP_057504869.1 phosphoribosylaminoimidazole-succinocarboxamide synthase, chloroplastic isoform X3 [Actinidia eriantha]XP_057504870.1 phosphoribosylaminoimidazole-succinocarboxamide synthase, chloroplastic isoform X3 [Actinidia eriantha]XP_057504871.1 phosphoribosylaminoimida
MAARHILSSSLNPPKALNPKKLLPINYSCPSPNSLSSLSCKSVSKSKKYPKFYISVMSNQQQQQQQPSLDVLSSSGRREEVLGAARSSLSNCLSETNLHLTVPGLKSKTRGKVRDIYDGGDYLVLVTTDRQSAFDRVLASIPFKGQVLNETSLWWFNKTQHITPNAVVSVPDKNVTIAKKCSVFPVEFVVRGYVTGSTDTSLWTVYKKGFRNYCGNILPDGMVKNQRLPANILTPTTKAADHDVPVTPDEIVQRGLMTQADYDEASRKALSLFEYGQRVASEHGLILVDTKYEFGKGSDGTVLLLDEVHTPDSSRYWIGHSYEERFRNGLEPENVDKEFLRLWFVANCNPYEDEVLPDAPEDLVSELAWRYIFLFETITKSKFEIPAMEEPIHNRISRNVSTALSFLQ